VTLEERKDLSHFSLDEMKDSLINHEHRLNRSSMSLENEFFVQSYIICGRRRGRDNSILSEVDAVEVLETLMEEVKTQIPISQVFRELKNQRFSAITVKSMDIMHMSARRDSIIRTSNVKISQTMKITKPILCLWCTH
jgi:hypothetical protein